jgi:excisionase family DNA binding protein
MRSRVVSIFTDAVASARVPVLDVASRYTELGEALLPLINPAVTTKYGMEITSFIVENVSVPPEVEQAIDKRSSMAAIGNLNEFVKYQMGKGFESGGASAGAAGTAAELAVGFGLAQQLMKDSLAGGTAAPTVAVAGGQAAAAAGAGLPELLSPAEAAQALGVTEADVLAVLEAGDLKGKKIGSTWRISRPALATYME